MIEFCVWGTIYWGIREVLALFMLSLILIVAIGPVSSIKGTRTYRIYRVIEVLAAPDPDIIYGDTSDGFVHDHGSAGDNLEDIYVGDNTMN